MELSTTQGSQGNAAPIVNLPSGYINKGEYIGTPNTGTDGTVNGKTTIFTVTTNSITNINFGIAQASENCTNNIDDDGDGDTDCADSECQPIITNVTNQEPSCAGNGQNGQITITATGQGSLSYSILNSPVWQSSNIFTNLQSGQYLIRVKNDAGCVATYSSMVLFDLGKCLENCSDGIDNDGDGLIDCDDPDCNQINGKNPIQNGGN